MTFIHSSFRRGLAVLVVFAGLLAGLTPRAARAEVSVSVLGIDAVNVPVETARLVTDALRRQAGQSAGLRQVPGKDLVEVKLVFGCMDEKAVCLAEAGRSLGVDRLIYGSLRRALGAPNYALVLKQLNVGAGQVDKFVSEAVPTRVLAPGGEGELSVLAQRWLGVLLLSELTGGLEIASEPAGAQVTLDGVTVGQTPLAMRDVAAGGHQVQVALGGYVPVLKRFEVRGGLVHAIHIVLGRRGSTQVQAVRAVPVQAPGAQVEAPAAGAQGPAEPAQRAEGPAAAPAAATTTGPAPVKDRGKPWRIASYVLVGAAAIAGGVSIYTWRTYSDEQQPARDALDVLQMSIPQTPELTDFFGSSDRMSSCDPPAELTTRAMANPVTVTAYNQYLDHCRRGRTYAGATTGLVATMGSLALLGVASFILGERLSHPGHKRGAEDAYKKASWFYKPRLKLVSPELNTAGGGGVKLSFEF